MPVLDETARGVFLIAVTPFTDDGALDLPSTDRVVDFYLERGVDGLTLLGVMGEAPKLTAAESRTFVRRVLDRVAGRVPVIVGVPAAGLAPMRELASEVMAAGAAGVMVQPPPSVKTDDQAFAHFEAVAEALGPSIPFALQDHPLATGVQLSARVILRIVQALPTCVMLKHEDWPGPGLAKLARDPRRERPRRGPTRLDPGRQRRRAAAARGAGAGCRRGDDRLRLPRDDGRRVRRARDRRRGARPRPVRRLPPARPLRAAGRPRPRGPQAPAGAAGCHRLARPAPPGRPALPGRHRRHRPAGRSAGERARRRGWRSWASALPPADAAPSRAALPGAQRHPDGAHQALRRRQSRSTLPPRP